jgi:hypothetical protein
VQGYQGGGESLLAFERNETDIYPTATLSTLRKPVDQGFIPFVQQGKVTAAGSFQRRSEFSDVLVLEELAKDLHASKIAWQAYVMRAGTDSAGRPFQAAAKTPACVVRMLRGSFARMSETTEFKTELKKISGEDAEILSGEEGQHILQQILVVSPTMQDYTNTLTKKYVNR